MPVQYLMNHKNKKKCDKTTGHWYLVIIILLNMSVSYNTLTQATVT